MNTTPEKGGRTEKVGLNITQKEFKQLSQWAEEASNIAVVVDYFVSNQPEVEECYNLVPVVKLLRKMQIRLAHSLLSTGENLEV